MDPLLLLFKILFLGGLPLAFLIGILRSDQYWPLIFCTFAGTTFSAINFRNAGSLANLAKNTTPMIGDHPGDLYHLFAWIICPLLLFVGTRKLLRLRAQRALATLLAEEEEPEPKS